MTEEETKQEDTSLIDAKIEEANKATKLLDSANAEKARLLEEEKKLLAAKTLAGSSDAGTESVEVKEETPAEYKDRVMRGELDDQRKD